MSNLTGSTLSQLLYFPIKSNVITCPQTEVILKFTVSDLNWPTHSWTEQEPFSPRDNRRENFMRKERSNSKEEGIQKFELSHKHLFWYYIVHCSIYWPGMPPKKVFRLPSKRFSSRRDIFFIWYYNWRVANSPFFLPRRNCTTWSKLNHRKERSIGELESRDPCGSREGIQPSWLAALALWYFPSLYIYIHFLYAWNE